MSDSLLDNLPDEVRELIRPHLDDLPPQLAAIGIEIAVKRDEAKEARLSSGIETTWKEAEEAYIGMDEANRHEFADARWAKPLSMDGPLTMGRPKGVDTRSTVYLRLTSRYVDAGAAKLCEILLPADDKAFSFGAMPVPDLIEAQEDDSQVVHSGLGVPLTRPLAPGEAPQTPGAPEAAPGAPQAATPSPAQAAPSRVPLTVKDLALEKIGMAEKRAKAAETRIWDWMVQGQYVAEMRKVISDAARIGTGILKAPVPQNKRVMAVTTEGDEVKLTIKNKIVPVAQWVDAWNIFPDGSCGENIHNGNYCFERDWMSERQVKGLKRLPGYIASQIDQVIKEGPNKAHTEDDHSNRGPGSLKTKGRFEVWYFYGTLTRDEMASIERAAGKETARPDDVEEVYAIVTLINDSVVRAVVNPLDSGSFPYHSFSWQRRAQHWAGIGVAEQMRAPQRITNAALRALLNNAGKASDNQYVIDQSVIIPADGQWTITPGKIWKTTINGEGRDVRLAFQAIPIPSTTDQLSKIIELGQQFAEETTSIPLVTQGQSGATTPDTYGAAKLQDTNANQLLRSIGYTVDDYITEPVVRQYYEWLLLDPDVPNEEKGEWQVNAHGSIALVERAIQNQFIGQTVNLSLNPAFGLNPKKVAEALLKANKIAPDTMQYTKQEQDKIDASPPPEAPAVTVAKIQAQTAAQALVAKQQSDQQTVESEERIEQAAQVLEGGKVQVQRQGIQVQATVALHKEQLAHERALMEYAVRNKISLDQAKAQLARTAMTLQTQRDLNAQDNAVDLHKHHTPPRPERPARGMRPPAQVPGRAGNGRAFEQGPVQ